MSILRLKLWSSLVVLLLLYCSGDANHQYFRDTLTWWDISWNRRIQVTIDNSTGTEAISDFPVLVNLTSTVIDYSKTQNSGQDIRFVSSDHSTLLNHEIEKWDESGTSSVWVSVDIPAGAEITFFIYYDNPTAAALDPQIALDVWLDSFVAVYHFTDLTDDSTSNGYNSTNNGATSDTGLAGNAASFSGAEYLSVAHNAEMTFVSTDHFTVEAVIYVPSLLGQWQGIVAKARNTLQYWGIWASNTDLWIWGAWNGAVHDNIGSFPMDTGWHTVVLKNDTSVGRTIYIDGAINDTGTSRNYSGVGPLIIGSATAAGERFTGKIDELRITSTDRSDEFVKAQHKNVNSTWIRFSSPENLN